MGRENVEPGGERTRAETYRAVSPLLLAAVTSPPAPTRRDRISRLPEAAVEVKSESASAQVDFCISSELLEDSD